MCRPNKCYRPRKAESSGNRPRNFRPALNADAILCSGGPGDHYGNRGTIDTAPPPARGPARRTTRPVMDLAKNFKIDSVSRLNPSVPLRISPSQTVADAVALMRRERV